MSKSAAVFANVKAWTEAEYGKPHSEKESSLTYVNGSTFVIVQVSDLGDNVMVIIGSPMGIDVPITGELAKHLLLEYNFMFGTPTVSLNDDGRTGVVTLRTILIGDELDKEELFVSMELIANTSNDHDEALVHRFGGRTVIAS